MFLKVVNAAVCITEMSICPLMHHIPFWKAEVKANFLVPPQVSDLVIILNYRRAVEAFTKGGNLTLGGNATVAVGPVGR